MTTEKSSIVESMGIEQKATVSIVVLDNDDVLGVLCIIVRN